MTFCSILPSYKVYFHFSNLENLMRIIVTEICLLNKLFR